LFGRSFGWSCSIGILCRCDNCHAELCALRSIVDVGYIYSGHTCHQHPTELDRQHWHTALLGYGIRSDEEPRDAEEDLNIIPGVLEKVVLPKLTGTSRHAQRINWMAGC